MKYFKQGADYIIRGSKLVQTKNKTNLLKCTPKKTIVFNETEWVPGMKYLEKHKYFYKITEDNEYKVCLGKGCLYFSQEEFSKYFIKV